MKIVIDIAKEEYECVMITGVIGNFTAVSNAIFNGRPLPKGHGRLIDADALQKHAIKVKIEHIAREIEVVTINQIKEAAAIPIIEGDRKMQSVRIL